ncbi:hypothetical protein BS47DRAFT_1364658 [Hydnum rufescens UP504]|uniref:Uncharacterized protein n=1 Tax=Hydnum rufescens UP504 TaxID=1448309 RepID=A0A9P6AQX8_9AGAM|nr:hypothetical protein BS47DRAFT_1364658 [Hydnum rufescens UP504]
MSKQSQNFPILIFYLGIYISPLHNGPDMSRDGQDLNFLIWEIQVLAISGHIWAIVALEKFSDKVCHIGDTASKRPNEVHHTTPQLCWGVVMRGSGFKLLLWILSLPPATHLEWWRWSRCHHYDKSRVLSPAQPTNMKNGTKDDINRTPHPSIAGVW